MLNNNVQPGIESPETMPARGADAPRTTDALRRADPLVRAGSPDPAAEQFPELGVRERRERARSSSSTDAGDSASWNPERREGVRSCSEPAAPEPGVREPGVRERRERVSSPRLRVKPTRK
jgi:hypothetical protein